MGKMKCCWAGAGSHAIGCLAVMHTALYERWASLLC